MVRNGKWTRMISAFGLIFFAVVMLTDYTYSQSLKEGHDDSKGVTRRPVVEFRALFREMAEEGYDVSKAAKLYEESKKARRKANNWRKARKLLNEAVSALKNAKKLPEQETRFIDLSVSSHEVYVTKAIPVYRTGKEIKDYRSAFKTETVKALDGKISLEICPIPVFIEEERNIPDNTSVWKNSPFGIEAKVALGKKKLSLDTCEAVADLGAKWVRYNQPQGLVWGRIEKEKGLYDWTSFDYQVSQAQKSGLELQVLIYPYASWDDPKAKPTKHGMPAKLPKDMEAYLRFIEKSVERYDGDGISDAPGSPLIKFWEVGTEMDTLFKWRDTPQNYALLLKKTYDVIKKTDPHSKVLISGWVDGDKIHKNIKDFWIPVLEELKKLRGKPSDNCFDICNLHWFLPDVNEFTAYLRQVRQLFSNFGFKSPPIWITSLATFSGKHKRGPSYRIHLIRNENVQAQELVTLHITALANGVERVFWGRLFDGTGSHWWNTCGLIMHPRSKGGSYKKIAYYAYKLMAEKLDSSDLVNIEILQNQPKGIYLYKFKKKGNGKATYVAWADL